MPVVTIQITRAGNTAEQKAQVIREVTETLQRVLHKAPERTMVVIEESEPENWGMGGLPALEFASLQARQTNPGSSQAG